MLPSLRDANLSGQKVLVRCDFNVPIQNRKVLDDFRIRRSIETINYLRERGAKIILISHLGQPEGREEEYSLEPVAGVLEGLLKQKVRFVREWSEEAAKQAVEGMMPAEILLLENLRFEAGERQNDENFAKTLAQLADVFVNEAFSVCHRQHASVVALPKLLPHFAGFGLEKEIRVLSQISSSPARPLVIIIGGVKMESKLKVVARFLEKADHILFGGKVVNMVLRVKGICVGKPWPDKEVVEMIQRLDITNPKIHLPIDALVSPDRHGQSYVRETGPGNVKKEEELFDIGPETISSFREIIKTAGTVFWAGPLGLFEEEHFSKGTREIARAIADNENAFKVAGGGDTITALAREGLLEKFSFISTGGGAMLAFLAGETLPGIEALKNGSEKS